MDITVDLSETRTDIADTPDTPEIPDEPDGPDEPPLIDRPERNLPFSPSAPGFQDEGLNVRMIEVNQGLSYGFDSETGELYAMQNFVAGKETAIFIAFEEPFDQTSEAVLTIEKDGQTVAKLIPAGIPDEYTLLFQPRDMAEVNYWTPGAYTFIFEMDGGRAVRTANFFESSSMKVLAVPVVANYAGRIVSCNGEWRNSSSMLIATYPIAPANMEYILGPELDLSASKYDLCTSSGKRLVWEALTNLQTRNNDYTLILGFIREGIPRENGRRTLGYTYGIPASVIVESIPDMLAVVPHEVAHCYKIGDEYPDGHLNLVLNPAPFGMSGRDIMTYLPVVSDSMNVVGGGDIGMESSGSLIYAEQRPYWVEGRQQLGLVTSYMGWCTYEDPLTRWTTSDIWNHIYYCLVGHTTTGDGGDFIEQDYWGQCPNCFGSVYDPDFYVECWQCCEFTKVTDFEFQCSNCEGLWCIEDYTDDLYLECTSCRHFIWYNWFELHNSGSFTAREAAQNLYLKITGYIDENGGFIASPWYTYEADQNVIVPSDLGEYSVYIYDGSGALLSVSYFNTSELYEIVPSGGPGPADDSWATVDVSVRFYETAAQIIIQKGDDVIHTQDVSLNTPTVAFTGLSAGQELSNDVTLTWDASDADGDELFFDLWYCPSEDVSFNIGSNITGRSVDVDLSELPGSNNGFFYIYATDGVRTMEIDSPRVRVPYKAPMILREPDGIPEYKLTELINFEVDIYDLQDGWMYGDFFEGSASPVLWMHEGREYYHNSCLTVFPFEFPPGLYTFTVIATNSAGLSSQRDYTIRILDDNSELPNDWSREQIRIALSWGIVLPLDRLDAPITRGQYAEIMTTSYGLFNYFMSDDVFVYPDYEEGVITDSISDWDRWHQFMVVYLGVMDAPNGIFNPTGTVTEQEAAVIMFRICALALDDPDIMDVEADEDFIVEWFLRRGIAEANGPNAFDGSARLSNRLAMVRTVRFILEIATRYL